MTAKESLISTTTYFKENLTTIHPLSTTCHKGQLKIRERRTYGKLLCEYLWMRSETFVSLIFHESTFINHLTSLVIDIELDNGKCNK